jgi:hypothetical protein
MRMLPRIVRHARVRLRHLKPEAKRDALSEVAANATVAYARLAEVDKADLAYPTVLANYAVAQYRDGRRVGNRLNVREVLSEYAQRRKHFSVESLDRFDEADGEWKEAVVQDTRTAPVPDIVCASASISPIGCAACRVATGGSPRTSLWVTVRAKRPSGSR